MKMSKYISVIGAANIDIGGNPYYPLAYEDSNPGDISISYGGVSRNISHNLTRLGVPVKLFTAIGDDPIGAGLLSHCRSIGIDMDHARIEKGGTSSMYMYINDNEGDLGLALADIKVEKNITPEYLAENMDVINGSEIVVADANLSEAAFVYLRDHCGPPLYVDPVSQAQARKIKNHLAGIHTLKPNRLEAEFLTDMTIQTEADYKAAAGALLAKGIKRVFISMGVEGMLAADGDNIYMVETHPAEVVNTTGAGDSAMAAIIWASSEFCRLAGPAAVGPAAVTAAMAANVVARSTIMFEETIDPKLSPERVADMIEKSGIRWRKL
jgi:pseudouridine kinase